MKDDFNKKNKKSKEVNKNGIKQSIYCVSCFNKIIWENNHYQLDSNNEEVSSVKTISQSDLNYDDNFTISIHQIDINKPPKSLNLFLNKKWKLNEITFSSKEIEKESIIILFVDIDINHNFLPDLLNDVKLNYAKEKKIDKISRNLETNKILDIYLNYFKQNKQNEDFWKRVKLNLVKQFIKKVKDDDDKSFFSNFIKIFNLSFGTKAIVSFVKCYENIDFQMDEFKDEEFENYVNLYEKDKNQFFSKNIKFFQGNDNSKSQNVQEYRNMLENFIIIYKLFYKLEDIIEDQPKITNVRQTLINLINNKKNLNDCIAFILNYFDAFHIVLKDYHEKLKIESKLSEEKDSLKIFVNIYTELVNLQKNSDFFLDFSPVFNYLVKEINEYENLIKIKSIYKNELVAIGNQSFEKKIKEKIYNSGMNIIKKGEYNNLFLVDFLKEDKEYLKNKKEKFSILKYFKVELMDDDFFNKFEKNKIYTIFEQNLSKYLESFGEIIKEIKDLGFFFRLLPPDKYTKETIEFVVDWVSKNINTFKVETCTNFKNDIKSLFKIMNIKTKYNKMAQLIETINSNIMGYSLDIFIFVLNSINNNEKIVESLTAKILIYDNDNNHKYEDIKVNNLYKFLKEVNPDKLVKKYFFYNIRNFYIEIEDYKNETNQRFNVFEKLLNNDSYSIFNEDNKNELYWENTLINCKKVSKDLKELNIVYTDAKYLLNLGKENCKKRIACIFKCSNEDEGLEIKVIGEMKKVIGTWENNIKNIEKLKEFNNFIYNNKEIENRKLSQYNYEIINSTLKNLNSKESLDKFSSYADDIERAQKVLKLKNSFLFLYILSKEKKTISDSNILENTFNIFNDIQKIFVNDIKQIENEFKNNSVVKLLINLGCQSQENLIKEIDWLLEYFQIYDFELRDFLIKRIKIFIKNKSIFSILNGVIFLFDIFKDIFNFNSNEDERFYNQLIEYNKSLLEERNITIEFLSEIDYYIEDKLGIQLNESNKLFNEVNLYPESMKFIKDKKYDELKNINEFLLESDDESFLNEVDINDFIKVVQFFEGIRNNQENINNFKSFVKEIIDSIKDNDKCGKGLYNYIKKYKYIQILINKYLHHTEGCIKKIKLILEYSKFNIQFKTNEYTIEGNYIKQSRNENTSNINILESNNSGGNNFDFLQKDHLELIYKRIFLAKIPEKYKDIINKFNNFYKGVKKLISIFNTLFSTGYHENLDVNIDFEQNNSKWKYKEKEYSMEELINKFSNLKESVINSLNKLYKENEIIRFFYGRQLYMIYNNIIKNNENNNLNLFKVIFSNNIKKIDINENNLNFGSEYYDNMKVIANYIYRQLKEINKKAIEDIYKLNEIKIYEFPLCSNKINGKKIKNETKYKGIFFYASKGNQQFEAISVYSVLTLKFPINSCFLYCTKDISIEELNCFLERCFLCEYHILFCMINVNLLNNNLKKFLIHFIKSHSKEYQRKMNSCLIIIFSGDDSDLHNILKKINVNPFEDLHFFENNEFTINNSKYKSSLVRSSYCGLGKSEFIKNKILNIKDKNDTKDNKKLNYIYFQISGQFKKEDLINRLRKMPDISDLNKKYLIHFDLNQNKEIELLNEFFFKLLILRKCDLDEDAIFFGKNVEIFIEIPNDFSDYLKDIKILSKLEVETINHIGKINPSEELKTISQILIMNEKGNILKKQSEILKNLEIKLSNEVCQEIVLRHLKDIKVSEPNYYQINIFIKVLYGELTKFINCQGYSVDFLINNAKALRMNEEDTKNLIILRKFIVDSFVNITKLIIIGPYEDLIKSQKINQKLLNENKEKEEQINSYLNIKIDSISFDKIKPSLVVFNEDGNSCTIITTCSEKENEFKNLEKLYKLQNIELMSSLFGKKTNNNEVNKLKSFGQLNNDEILDSLLNFLNVSGFFNEEKKREVMGSYVYTPDNFIKVVLILMRIRVKIPIIMMGETGCGKTTLIEMASKLYNQGKSNIKKMNIHAGITDEDIIYFFKKTKLSVEMEDNKMLKEKKKRI